LPGVITVGEPTHGLPAIDEGLSLISSPTECIKHVVLSGCNWILQMLNGEVGGVAGMWKILVSPFHFPLLPLTRDVRAIGLWWTFSASPRTIARLTAAGRLGVTRLLRLLVTTGARLSSAGLLTGGRWLPVALLRSFFTCSSLTIALAVGLPVGLWASFFPGSTVVRSSLASGLTARLTLFAALLAAFAFLATFILPATLALRSTGLLPIGTRLATGLSITLALLATRLLASLTLLTTWLLTTRLPAFCSRLAAARLPTGTTASRLAAPWFRPTIACRTTFLSTGFAVRAGLPFILLTIFGI
jgi:hypothetical protein